MKIRIIGAESLGVRSMCCVVETKTRRVLIDPGVALAPRRSGLVPHKIEVGEAAAIREKILNEVKMASDVVISHFHGDHAPLLEPDPYQINLIDFVAKLGVSALWVKGRAGNTRLMDERLRHFAQLLGDRMVEGEGKDTGDVTFSLPCQHGVEGRGMVMMTRVSEGNEVFVHGSDIQLLAEDGVEAIIAWKPDVVFVAGPPIYLSVLSKEAQNRAFINGVKLARAIGLLIVDHHLLRSETGREWLENLSARSKARVVDAATFMGLQTKLLEANRKRLYEQFPV
ncbi:MAG: hypothetical protein K6T77_02500 [candidate division WOR-3 bacterium]|jgi:predicted metallo-beta-lactamase superfamily hydrolase|nr:hypothetical protein [candidate division WOR-3 bacterium]MCR4423469.1 hypothetical protein [candidate division WOR-3 bacterium]MDH7518808.1 hypothetical protein [bacterium]